MEQWLPIPDFPLYEASDQGRIRNIKSGGILTCSKGDEGRPHVGLMQGAVQVKRGLSLLICKTFLTKPRWDFNTPIHFDGILLNCRLDNLAWRPRWFAVKHIQQFRVIQTETGPVRDIKTGVIYVNVWSVVFHHGVLYNDVVKSIINKTYVFPTMQCFEWVNPD